ncbi:hypothetical protein [Streptomyces sp. NPDC050704]|uniref:hypothetical protein n=1 Tax=Streptomyces sp. NPDC050704 TaxID=3157219 RepID=UPI003446B359
MGRGILLIAFFVTVFHLVPAVTAVAEECPDNEVLCWAQSEPGKPLPLTIDKRLPLGKEGEDALRQADRHARLTVSVADSVTTGIGGTVLFVLADKRKVGQDSEVSGLSPETGRILLASPACSKPCEDAVKRLTDGSARGRDLIRGEFAGPLDDDSKGSGLLTWLTAGAAAALLLLVALLALAVRRTRVSPAPAVAGQGPAAGPRHRASPRPSQPARPGEPGTPRRTAAVRTPLRPQGYVELDHCLYRAEWSDADAQPPDPGALVDVADPAGTPGDPDVLIALPRRPHRRAADDHT